MTSVRWGCSAAVVVAMAAARFAAGQTPDAPARSVSEFKAVDGPSIEGHWAPADGAATQENIEEGLDPAHNKILGRPLRPSLMIVDPPDRKIPYQQWAAARRKELFDNRDDPKTLEHVDPAARCFLPGVPRNAYMPFGYKIIQPPGYVVILNEAFHAYRIIPVTGARHVGSAIKLWMGDSRGRWEGNTLIVDVTNLNGGPWFDFAANFQSPSMRVVERWTLSTPDRIDYAATIEDPTLYTRPWTIAFPIVRNEDPRHEVIEEACHEGNRAMELMLR
jgi:hypothetical protein